MPATVSRPKDLVDTERKVSEPFIQTDGRHGNTGNIQPAHEGH